ncbi:MULE domain-containing protein [Aphis craccivora]|uniref:MULE domain-containing protein n=1 Tax=Aphis craccivora TaxID=307492 RepID=A0A6G0YH79_APHCR|nr:MULE domain-containing protein [Aphis craccivora]
MDLSTAAIGLEIEIIETTKIWVCLNENKEKCKGRMRTKNIEIINFSDDLCKPDVATSECEKTEESSYTESEIFR